ncbi:uncharacterized protein [Clytia hemisphaerica]|uniref:Condensation domain-containing protein n=1 Tax=Clytia hemisphaerica TaxID=252671 RepID=A0A7M6DPQ5_9CNID
MSEQIRKLGFCERANADRKKIYNIVCPTLLKTRCQIDTHLLDQAVYKVIKSQPNINAVLRFEGEDIYFKPLKEIEQYFEVLPKDATWKDVCIEYNNKHLRPDFETYPPFKLVLIQPCNEEAVVIAVASHYCMDGTGITAMTSLILETYSELQKDANYEPMKYPAPKSFEDYRLEFFGSEEKFREQQKSFKEFHLNVMDSANCYFEFEENDRVVFTPYSSTEIEFENFKKECKAKGITVGAALCGVQACAMAACMFKNQKDVPDVVNLLIEIPINLRGRITKEVSWKCANYMPSNPYITVKVGRGSTFWETARQVKDTFNHILSDKSMIYLFDLFTKDDLFDQPEEKERLNVTKKKIGGLERHTCFSNMLKFPAPLEHKDFTVEASYCCGGQWLLPAISLMVFFVYSTKKLNFTMVHRDGVLNVGRAEKVMKYVQYFVENVTKFGEKDITTYELSQFGLISI